MSGAFVWVGPRALRARRGLLMAFLAAGLACLAPAGLVDRFFEGAVERRALEVWRRQAVDASYQDCRADSGLCLGRVVAWSVTHPAAGVTHHRGDASEPILWANEDQVPIVGARQGSLEAVAWVRAIHPRSVELVFLGSPQASYMGRTWAAKFGLEEASARPRK